MHVLSVGWSHLMSPHVTKSSATPQERQPQWVGSPCWIATIARVVAGIPCRLGPTGNAVITVEKPCDMSFRCICDWRRFMFRFRSWYVGCTIVLIVSDECTWSTIYQAHACCSHPVIVSNRPHFSRCMPIIVGYIYIIFVGLGIFSCLLPQSCSLFPLHVPTFCR